MYALPSSLLVSLRYRNRYRAAMEAWLGKQGRSVLDITPANYSDPNKLCGSE